MSESAAVTDTVPAPRAIVAIGASAGGLEPLQALVAAIPGGAEIAWVVVQHLSAGHRTILHELLADRTRLPVEVLDDGATVAADRIGVAPPGHAVRIDGTRFRLEPITETGVRTPIDTCFASVAEAVGERGFCVVLSGTGSDGSAGLKRIKQVGGMAFAQTAYGARFPGMPDSARATGLVDFTLAPPAIPARIVEILDYRSQAEDRDQQAERFAEIEAALPTIVTALKDAGLGQDFSGYKPGTLLRRVERRMALTHHRSVGAFLRTLEGDEDERALLAQDFRIGVTRFFRDPEAFDALGEKVLPELARRSRSAGDALRIWVCGCSTGEEVYSIAMTVLERLDEIGSRTPLQVFGTDIDAAALYHARQGIYAPTSLENVPAELRERWFVGERGQLRASTTLRDSCVFALHDVISDPPFSRVDLVSCRNLMIYLNGDTQHSVLHRLHYALNRNGTLFLGPCETPARAGELFHDVDPEHRLYRRNDDAGNRYTTLQLTTPLSAGERRRRSVARPATAGSLADPVDAPDAADATRRSEPAGGAPDDRAAATAPAGGAANAFADRLGRMAARVTGDARAALPTREQRIERYFLEHAAPAFAVVDPHDRVVYLSSAMTRFVRPVAGAVSVELDALMTPDLARPARRLVHALRRAASEPEAPAELERASEIRLASPATDTLVRLRARRLPDEHGSALLVIEPLAQPERLAPAERGGDTDASRRDGRADESLEEEIARLRRELDIALQDNDASQQELRSTNEELLSMNVEMQSANEELETSREELQSINEELQTVNAELNENNQQLKRANDDLKNLFESSDLPTLFLDPNLLVRGFTPQLETLFAIRERDVGRPLGEIHARFALDSLEADARDVFTNLEVVDREIEIDVTGEAYILRIRPYRTVDDRLDGLVLTFFDITQRVRQQRQLKQNATDLERQYAELETLYDTTPVGLSLVSRDLRWLRINEELAAINGFPPEAHIGKRQQELIPDIDQRIAEVQRSVLETGKAVRGIEVHGMTPAEPDRPRDWIVDLYPVRAGSEVFALGTCVREVTEQKTLQLALQAYVDRLRLAVTLHPIHFQEIDAEGRLVFASSENSLLPGADAVGTRLVDGLPEAARAGVAAELDAVLGGGERRRLDVELVIDGHASTWDLSIEPLLVPDRADDDSVVPTGPRSGALLVWFDVTARKADESRAILLLAELQHRVKNTLSSVLAIVRFMSRDAASVEAMRDELTARLQAIARTHDLLTGTDWQAASIEQLVDSELAPYLPAGDRRALEYTGPAIGLPPREALALGMAIHELATNSAKHGALSRADGRVLIATQRTGDRIRFEWREPGIDFGGAPPERKGFGRFLLEEALPTQIEGNSELVFGTDGVSFVIDFPVARLERPLEARLASGAARANGRGPWARP